MPIEIEKKYRLVPERREELKRELEESGARFVGREFEENTIYSNDRLRDTGSIVRIRKTDSRSILTFKRRVENQFDVKQQIEHETEISDPTAAESIIGELGLKPVLIYQKYRDTWNFRSVELVLDELPFGDYMEIEGSITGIKEAEILLGIEDLETEHETYPRLTARLGQRNGEQVEARFKKEGV
ncbi:MAG: class IV adenylate cyclase [bacterium]|nr:class IV adenylate cyclase [bacterium]